MMDNVYYNNIMELALRIKHKEISPVEVTNKLLDRIDVIDKQLNSYITITKDNALKVAKDVEKEIMAGKYRGPLHGIPIAVKDNIYTKGVRTTAGSRVLQNFFPDYDATVVEKLKKSGSVLLGKLNTHEFAAGISNINPHYGNANNPWDMERIPGGSSGGSAAAVSAGLTFGALGTDTGGSIRIPSAFCGVVGLKPTYGRVSNYGSVPLAWSLDHIGPIARSVGDVAIIFESIAGYDEKDPTSTNKRFKKYTRDISKEINNIKIGIPTNYFFDNLEQDVEVSVKKAIKTLENCGASIVEVEIPELDVAEYAGFVTIRSEAATYHYETLKQEPDLYGKDVKITLKSGELISSVQYLKAQQARRKLQEGFSRVFQQVDLIIAPTLTMTAPKRDENYKQINGETKVVASELIRSSIPMNLTGLPSLSIPVGFSSDGLPIAMQIIGKPFDEHAILDVATVYERERGDLNFRPIE